MKNFNQILLVILLVLTTGCIKNPRPSDTGSYHNKRWVQVSNKPDKIAETYDATYILNTGAADRSALLHIKINQFMTESYLEEEVSLYKERYTTNIFTTQVLYRALVGS